MEADRINQKRILIAEDNQDHRIILRHQLHRLGAFAILEATTGQEALLRHEVASCTTERQQDVTIQS
jgi:CheY-like chemotaxis protein